MGLAPESLRTLGEIYSGRRVHAGGAVNLTSKEWFDRWQLFRKAHPDYRPPGREFKEEFPLWEHRAAACSDSGRLAEALLAYNRAT